MFPKNWEQSRFGLVGILALSSFAQNLGYLIGIYNARKDFSIQYDGVYKKFPVENSPATVAAFTHEYFSLVLSILLAFVGIFYSAVPCNRSTAHVFHWGGLLMVICILAIYISRMIGLSVNEYCRTKMENEVEIPDSGELQGPPNDKVACFGSPGDYMNEFTLLGKYYIAYQTTPVFIFVALCYAYYNSCLSQPPDIELSQMPLTRRK